MLMRTFSPLPRMSLRTVSRSWSWFRQKYLGFPLTVVSRQF
jgi:hypothetical protein